MIIRTAITTDHLPAPHVASSSEDKENLMSISDEEQEEEEIVLTNGVAVLSPSKAAARARALHSRSSTSSTNASTTTSSTFDANASTVTTTIVRYKLRESTDILKQQTTARINQLRLLPKTSCCLYSGARFFGQQRSGRNSYDVSVVMQVS